MLLESFIIKDAEALKMGVKMLNVNHDSHVVEWAKGQLNEATGSSGWMRDANGDYCLHGPHGRLERFAEIILKASQLISSSDVVITSPSGDPLVFDAQVPQSLVAARLTIPGSAAENSFFHKELQQTTGEFAAAVETAGSQNLADLVVAALSRDH